MFSTGGIKKDSDGKIKEGSALMGTIFHEVSDNLNKTTNENWEQVYTDYILNLKVSITIMLASEFYNTVKRQYSNNTQFSNHFTSDQLSNYSSLESTHFMGTF